MGLLKTHTRDEMLSTFVWMVHIFALMCMLSGCSKVNEWLGLDEDDGWLEESAEAVFEEHTGFDIDFTPFSSER